MSENFTSKETATAHVEIFGTLEETEKFPGAKILTIKEGNTYTRYALRRNEQGELEGNEFEMQEKRDGVWESSGSAMRALDVQPDQYRVGPTYQIHSGQLASLETLLKEKGISI